MTKHDFSFDFSRIGIIGFGEVGKIFARELRACAGVRHVFTWDKRWRAASHTKADDDALALANAQAAKDAADLCAHATFLISAVTASNTLAVAQEIAPWVRSGHLVLDLNSASPGTKQHCARLIESNGAAYVEAGVMTSVPPYGIKVPMLLGGAHASALATHLNAWGMDAKAVSSELGVASAIKMCRSIMIKGLEALVIESYTTARAYGVEDAVLPTLVETFPAIDWEKQGDYFFQRVVQHGQRRSEEMFESAETVREIGLDPLMATAIAQRQQWVAQERARGVVQSGVKPWREQADALIAQSLKKPKTA
jgi:3-hydroxyisobutyrate dehydrogenase-like beta-hydroxyacid dehydrogenase